MTVTDPIATAGRRWSTETTGGRQAADAPFCTEPGPDPDRILLVGSGAAEGHGVASHALALPGTLARAVAARSGRGATVEVVAGPAARLADVGALVAEVRLSRFDAVVVLTGGADAVALRSRRAWRRALTATLDQLQAAAALDTSVLVVGLPAARELGVADGLRARIVERHARALDTASAAVAELRPRVHFAAAADPGPRDAAAWYEALGTRLAATLEPVLSAGTDRPAAARAQRAAPDPEDERVAALARTRLATDRDHRFDELAVQARQLLGGDVAAIGFLDAGTHWFSSVVGAEFDALPRDVSLCDRTIASDGPFVVGDLQRDRSFDGNPIVHGDPPVRFYAGFPIETLDGYRIGSICVLGHEARDPATVDLTALRRLASMARAEVWQADRQAAGALTR